MSNRILKDSICTSDTIANLRSAEAEVLFYRLLVVADDYGCFDGRVEIIRAQCYPLVLDGVTPTHIKARLEDLTRVGLVQRYEVGGKSYIALSKWMNHQRLRQTRHKWPEPPGGNSPQLAVSCGLNPNPNPNPNPNQNPKEKEKEPSSDGLALAKLLQSELIRARPTDPTSKLEGARLLKHLDKWARKFDRFGRIDKVSKPTYETIIKWAMVDDFWKNNIRSPSSLRTIKDGASAKVWVDFEVVKNTDPQAAEMTRRAAACVRNNPECLGSDTAGACAYCPKTKRGSKR